MTNLSPVTRGQAVAAEAREWIGTPVVWQQSAKQRGVDCKGLVQGVARQLGYPEADSAHAAFVTYSDHVPVPVDDLRAGLQDLFDQVDEAKPGDILLLNWRGRAQHLAIVIDDRSVVHARGSAGKVVEARLSALCRMSAIDSIWRWRA